MASCDAAASADAAAAMQKLMLIAADAATGASCGKAQNPKRLLLHCQTQRTQQERQASRGGGGGWGGGVEERRTETKGAAQNKRCGCKLVVNHQLHQA